MAPYKHYDYRQSKLLPVSLEKPELVIRYVLREKVAGASGENDSDDAMQ